MSLRGGFEALRHDLVNFLISRGTLQDEKVVQAMEQVPRHLFVNAEPCEAYADKALCLKEVGSHTISTISQPSIVAHMLQELNLYHGSRILEIGSGLGYNAALLSLVTGPKGKVTTVEYDSDLANEAVKNLRSYNNVEVINGDGRKGYLPDSPYDRIIATATCEDIFPQWQTQLADGGEMLVPLKYGLGFTRLLSLKKSKETFEGRFGWSVSFVEMPGNAAGEETALDAEIRRVLSKNNLSYAEKEAFLFYFACSGEQPDTAFRHWQEYGRPMPEDFLVSTAEEGIDIQLPSLTLNLVLSKKGK